MVFLVHEIVDFGRCLGTEPSPGSFLRRFRDVTLMPVVEGGSRSCLSTVLSTVFLEVAK